MRRILFNTFALLSFLLCIFLIYSYLRSFLPSKIRFESIDGSLVILTWEGEGSLDQLDQIYSPSSDKFFGLRSLMKIMSVKTEKHFLGFRSITGGGIFRGVNYHIVAIPYWIIIPPTAILPILWLISRRRHRQRVKNGHCLKCGYDLRESKLNCPECGASIPAPLTANPSAV